MIRILGLDIGSVRVGVALSDPLGITAQPLTVLERRKTDVFAAIAKLVDEHEVQSVVVGRPLQLDGQEGLAVQAAEKFVAQLASNISVPIEWWDERLSTAQAQKLMIHAGTRREKRRQSIDKVAAALILQSFLDARSQP